MSIAGKRIVATLLLAFVCLPPRARPDIMLASAVFPDLEIMDSDSVLQPFEPLKALFSGEKFAWKSVPAFLRGMTSVRTALGRSSPLHYRARRPGTLYAALWTWDFGFLQNLPDSQLASYNGWKKTGAEATIGSAPDPFARVPVYSRSISQGGGALDLDAYFGQWVILGFVAAPVATGGALETVKVTVAGSQSRHNVVEPGQRISLESAHTVRSFALYHEGSLVASGPGSSLAAPSKSGRYALQAVTGEGTALMPLTVALPAAPAAGWEKGFFPIIFYNGYSYAGLFRPNSAQLQDLQTLAMFELGANTFFQGRPNPLLSLLHARVLLNVKSTTIPMVRKTPEESAALAGFRDLLGSLAPLPTSTLGLYVEDEPPFSAAPRLSVFSDEAHRVFPGVPLLYTVLGSSSPQFWKSAGSDVRMARAYPIRKKRRGDLRASIQKELADLLSASQSAGSDKPLWLVVQAFGDSGRPGIWDSPTPAQLRLMVNLALARGVRALTYFCWDSSPRGAETLVALARWPFVPQDGLYAEVGKLNRRISGLHDFLSSTAWTGSIEQPDSRFDVQIQRAGGGSQFAWITNWDTDQRAVGTVATGATSAPITVNLEPGGSMIVDLGTGRKIDPGT